MPRIIYRHQPATRFIVSAIGDPGERQFFIQVKSADGINSVTLEKSQVIALTQRFEDLIRELRRGKLVPPADLSAVADVDDLPMELPIDEDFQVGIISITWENDLVVVNIQAISQDDDLILDDLDYNEYIHNYVYDFINKTIDEYAVGTFGNIEKNNDIYIFTFHTIYSFIESKGPTKQPMGSLDAVVFGFPSITSSKTSAK